jgi:DNA-binding protein YbaB
VKAACGDAIRQIDELSSKKMSGMLGGMGLPPGLF